MKMKKPAGKSTDGIAKKGKTETKQVKMAMGGGTPMMANKMMGGGMPQAPGKTMPQAGNKPTALPSGATPYGKPVQMAPKGGIADEGPGGMIIGQRGPQTGGPGLSLQQGSPGGFGRGPMPRAANSPTPQAANSPTPQAHRWQDYDDTPKADPRKPEFSLTGMQAAYEKGQQPGVEFSNQEQYKRGPERYVEEDMPKSMFGGGQRTGGPGLGNPMAQAPSDRFAYKKGGSIKAKKGGSVKSSASKRADGCATKGKTRGRMC